METASVYRPRSLQSAALGCGDWQSATCPDRQKALKMVQIACMLHATLRERENALDAVLPAGRPLTSQPQQALAVLHSGVIRRLKKRRWVQQHSPNYERSAEYILCMRSFASNLS